MAGAAAFSCAAGVVGGGGAVFAPPLVTRVRPRTRVATMPRGTLQRSVSTRMAAMRKPVGEVVPAIVVVDHGSRSSAANAMLEDIANMIRPRSAGVPVYCAHMELSKPSIEDAFQQAVQNGATHVVVVPFFLAPGKHVLTDIPRLVGEAADKHGDITFDIRQPIGTHPAIADVVIERAGVVASEKAAW